MKKIKLLFIFLITALLSCQMVFAKPKTENKIIQNQKFSVLKELKDKLNSEKTIETFSDMELQQGLIGAKTLYHETFNAKGIFTVLEAIERENGKLSDERKEILVRALEAVGRYRYSQAHHLCSIYGPCKVNKNENCFMNDCSGFVSDIWQLPQKENTATFYYQYKVKKISDNIKPGDILLHYDGQVADCNGDHALLYAGKIGKGHCVIDCSTNGVTMRTCSYFDECIYIDYDSIQKTSRVINRKTF